jgi:cytochrome c peroxidase
MASTFRARKAGALTWAAAATLALVLAGLVATKAQTQTETFTCAGGFTEEVAPPVRLASLLAVENPVIPKDPITGAALLRGDLTDYIRNLDAAIRLGKALFWDMQAGSDNKTACATCHFQAGEDVRTRNQLHPGANGRFDDAAGFAANVDLWAGAYPFTDAAAGRYLTDNITGSQGVRKMVFEGIDSWGAESTSSVPDPVFNVNGVNVRQVTGRQAPSSVNAVFYHRQFHDGRGQPEFNGVNPFGTRDTSARVWYVGPLGPTQIDIRIDDASLASQSVGPVLNDVEMSAVGRTWTDLGRKLLRAKPLGLQQVSPGDSVLGLYSDAPNGGLKTTYKSMIAAAFKPKWWDTRFSTSKLVTVNGEHYTLLEANMSLFWGLSVMLYQATLVADQTPMDRFLAARSACSLTDPLAYTTCIEQNDASSAGLLDDIAARLNAEFGSGISQPPIARNNLLNGLALFELPPPPAPGPNGAGCILCHVGAETTGATGRNLFLGVEPDDVAFANAGFDLRMERMWWRIPPLLPGTDQITLDPLAWTVTEFNTVTGAGPADVPLAVYDAGYYNLGVRPTAEDLSTANLDPFGNPWSIVRYLLASIGDPSSIKIPGATVNCGATFITNSAGVPLLAGSLRKTERTLVAGSFKVPGLRNVELNGPYFHSGGKATLFQLMEFYDAGGDFPTNAELAPLIRPLGMTAQQIRDVIAFMLALTDERVRYQRAPFDHPQLFVPNGDIVPGVDNMLEIPATGAGGGAPLQRFLGLNPFM